MDTSRRDFLGMAADAAALAGCGTLGAVIKARG